MTEVPLIKYGFILLPGSTCPFCELNKVFLSTGTDLMGQLTINVIKLGQIGFREHLRLGILNQEFIPFSLGHATLFLLILSTGAFVIPISTILISHDRRSKHSSGEVFHSNMEGMVGEEISITDLILLVCILCNIGNQHHCLFRSNHGQLHRDINIPQSVSALLIIDNGCCQGCRCLTTVDDLKRCNLCDISTAIPGLHFYCISSSRNTIVIRKEHTGFVQNGITDTFVDFTFCGQEGSHVAFQQTASICIIQISQYGPGNIAEVCCVLLVGASLQTRNAIRGELFQINYDILFSCLGRIKTL